MTPLQRFNRIRDIPIPRFPKLVLFLLAAYANKDGRESFPSPQTLARQGDMSVRSAREAIRYLTRSGLVKAYNRLPKPRQYTIHLPERVEEWQGLPQDPGRICQQKKTSRRGAPHRFRSDLCKSCHQHLAVLDGQCNECINARARTRERQQRDALPSL